jgi:hypothetical protein
MARQWGLPQKEEEAFLRARRARPLSTLGISAVFGILGAAISTLSFAGARGAIEHVYHGWSLILAVIAGGFGCWLYIWIARPRFAAHFSGGDDFSDLLRFFARAALALVAVFGVAQFFQYLKVETVSALLFCASGGAAAAAAFQTVLAFVPAYRSGGPS